MDYVFFATNALCVGFSTFSIFWLTRPRQQHLAVWHYLLAAAGAAIYYLISIYVFANWLLIHYLANTLPILLMFGLTGLMLWTDQER